MQEKNLPTVSLRRVEPIVQFGRCARQVAGIRNKTVTSMENGNTEDVAYRYLQSRTGESNTFREVLGYGLLLAFALSNLIKPGRIVLLPFVLPIFALFILNISNTLRYRETKHSCEAWLKQRSMNKFNNIQSLSYDSVGLFKLKQIFDKEDDVIRSEALARKTTPRPLVDSLSHGLV